MASDVTFPSIVRLLASRCATRGMTSSKKGTGIKNPADLFFALTKQQKPEPTTS